MRRSAWQRLALTATLAFLVLSGALLTSHPAIGDASRSSVDMNVTLSVYSEGGTLQGFNDADPTHIYSLHNIYAKLWAKKFPHLRWKETYLNSPGSLETKLTLAVNAGNPPDMAFISGSYLGFTVVRHLAQPLDAYFKRYHIAPGYFLPGLAHWAHFGGHWWAMPAVSGPLAGQYAYLPKYMTPLGYNNSNLRTFADYYQMSKKAVRFDKAGNLARIGYWPGVTPYIWQRIGRLMCPVGHGLYNQANQPTATDPCNVAYLSYLKKLVDLYGGYAKLS